MKKLWEWLKGNWQYVALTLGGVVAGALFQIKIGPKKAYKYRQEALEEMSLATTRALETSTEVAVQELEERHAQTTQALSEAQKRKAESLRADPSALARYLVRVGQSLSSPRD